MLAGLEYRKNFTVRSIFLIKILSFASSMYYFWSTVLGKRKTMASLNYFT